MKRHLSTAGLAALIWLLGVCLTVMTLPQAFAQPRVAARAAHASALPAVSPGQAATPLEGMLNGDGTLNLSGGFHGSLDARGWQMVSSPSRPPRFIRAAPSIVTNRAIDAGQGKAEPSVAGDENWDGRFGV